MSPEETQFPTNEDALRPPSWLGGGGLSDTVFAWQAPIKHPSPEQVQEEFTEFRIEELLGHGGMGVVYRGVELSTGREVAVKLLPQVILERGGDALLRFEQEALVMQHLDHPHIVKHFRHGATSSGMPYLAMEFVGGMDVADRLRREGRFAERDALRIASEVAAALHYAHSQGVIHRDIKPGNVLLTVDGSVKVADFGLARLEDESGLSGLTQSFQTMGSVDYQAPEALIMGPGVDERADLYALGVMIYHMLVGQVPRGIFHLPSKIRPELDPRIDMVVSNLLQQNPYERTGSARDLHLALVELQQGRDQAIVEPQKALPGPRDKRWWWIALGIAGMAAVGVWAAMH